MWTVTTHAVSRETLWFARDSELLADSTESETCRRRDAHGANDGRSASGGGVPLGLRPAPPVQYASLHSLHMAPRDNASTEPRSHNTHQIHKCGARCNSLTPTLHCQQLFIMIYLLMYWANTASDRPAISQHN